MDIMIATKGLDWLWTIELHQEDSESKGNRTKLSGFCIGPFG